jgi:hypothetical protein
MYQILDEGGGKVGVPVKASSIYSKPTLSYLEQKFKENAAQKEGHKKQLQTSIDWVMVRPPKSLAAFGKELQKESISLITRQNEEGFVYGLTYIDHRTRCVFNGSDLGKPYSAKAVLERCGIQQAPKEAQSHQVKPVQFSSTGRTAKSKKEWNKEAALHILERLLKPEEQRETIPLELKKQKKKRRKI